MGSNFVLHRKFWYGDDITVLDKLTYSGLLDNLLPLSPSNKDFIFYKTDIGTEEFLTWLCSLYTGVTKQPLPDLVVHFAAESHVDNSIASPRPFVTSNVVGSFNISEFCRLLKVPMIAISTDEVVEHKSPYTRLVNAVPGKDGTSNREESLPRVFNRVRETVEGYEYGYNIDPIFSPSSVYSATKAGAEMLYNAYKTTYGVPIDIVRCVNNYGPRQHLEKLIPKAMACIAYGRKIPIYGAGDEIRDWIYVQDMCRALDTVIKHKTGYDIWHISANDEITNKDLIHLLLDVLGASRNCIQYITPDPRPGHDPVYSLSSQKLRSRGWKPEVKLEDGLEKTFDWYVRNERLI